jgi:hypothetical protein
MMDWPGYTRGQAILASHRIARRFREDVIVVMIDLPHIFHCFGANVAPVFEASPHYQVIYHALARLAAPESAELEEEA